jgi:hypothetical protein
MGAFSLPIQPRTNPYLDEIDAAAQGAHAQLSPGAQEALKRAGAPIPGQAAQQPTQRISSPPQNAPGAIPMGEPTAAAPTTAPIAAPARAPITPVPLSPEGQAAQGEVNRLLKPPPSNPALVHTKENTGASGINQIHSPWARIPLQIAEAIGTGFAPGLASAIPGTQLHHNVLVNQAEGAVTQQQKQRADEEAARTAAATQGHVGAQADLAEAQAQALGEESRKNTMDVGPGHGVWNLKEHKWDVEPTSIDGKNVTEVDPEFGAMMHIIPTKDGRYLAPNAVLGEMLKAKTQPKTLIEKAMADHPEWGAEELQQFLAKQPKESQLSADDEAIIKSVGGDPRVDIRDQPIDVVNKFLAKKKERVQTPPTPPIVLVPNEQGMMVPTQAKLGVPLPANFGTISGTGGANAKAAEGQASAKAALDYATSYMASGKYTGPGDEALMEKYFELAKPSTGFRMSQPQIDMLMRARSWMGSVEGIAYHAKSGQWFPPQQRQEIVDTMTNLGTAKGIKPPQAGGGGGAQSGPSVGTIENTSQGNFRFKGGDPKQQANWEKVP